MKRHAFLLLFLCGVVGLYAQSLRECIRLDEGWKFSLGHAASPQQDFGSGTEYFNYLTKANSIHNEGPYVLKFDDQNWKPVRLPHDWVPQLPYDSLASHSHGYRTIGYKYPEYSVGWYRKVLPIAKEDEGKHFFLQFDGIFRNATVWVNGFYMGGEPSGYASQVYDITDYIHFGGDNLIAVRADASLEEGWFYEGAGIYRDAWLIKTAPVHVAPFGTFIHAEMEAPFQEAMLQMGTEVKNSGLYPVDCEVEQRVKDDQGNTVATIAPTRLSLKSKEVKEVHQSVKLLNPHLWSLDDPYLYEVETRVLVKGTLCDTYTTRIGVRDIRWDKETGLFLNGEPVKLKGVNMHQDHAGVGCAIPDALQAYRIRRLKSLGCNAYRASHNPMTPAMLDVCDREGILVIEENRLMGINDEHIRLLERMIKRDRNHPCIILWSTGNEEWGLENTIQGWRVAASMREYAHRLDSTRLSTAANAGGVELIKALDVVGYNYLAQNDIDGLHREFPERIALGSEETTGCGTRGIYFDDRSHGRMAALNRTDTVKTVNVIERGWKFYDERPWLSGLFYWTGFDYRGESNPLVYPAVGSQFGILDYCGFDKDEAYYLKAWWTDEPVLHIFPHWNLQGHEGETVDIWAYSNCDEVELWVNGKKLGRKAMPKNGHLSWKAVYEPGRVKAVGYKQGRKLLEKVVYTTQDASQIVLQADRSQLKADHRDLAVVTVELKDAKGRFVPTACNELTLTLEGEGRILGVGNGDPAFKGMEHPDELECKSFSVPAFNGLAQVLIQTSDAEGEIRLTCSGDGLKSASVVVKAVK